jgi:hypothetical protein
MPRHRDLSGADLHGIHAFVVADAVERAALLVNAADVGKVALQLSDKTFWILSGYDPATWVQAAGSSGTGIGGIWVGSSAPAQQVTYEQWQATGVGYWGWMQTPVSSLVVLVSPPTASLALTANVPAVSIVGGSIVTVSPPTASLVLAANVPAVSVIAATSFVDLFNDSSLDAARWSARTANAGSVVESTVLNIGAVATANAAMIVRKASFARGATKTVKVDFSRVAQGTPESDVFAVVQSVAEPVTGASTGIKMALRLFKRDTAGTGTLTLTRYTAVGGNADLFLDAASAAGTSHRIIFESNATQWRLRLVDPANEATVRIDAAWVDWSDTQDSPSGAPLWIVLGDPFIDWAGCDLIVTRYEEIG